MRIPARTVAALAGLGLAGSLAVVTGPDVAAGSAAAGPVEDAREAARRVPFSARVEVSWVDKAGVHTAELGVRAVGGSIRVQGPVGQDGAGDGLDGGSPMMLRASAVTPAAGGGADDLLAPELEQKYDVERSDGPLVAGRETDLFVLRSGDAVRERLAIDTETGLVLRREVIGAGGEPVRIVTVLQLDTAPVPEAADADGAGAASPPKTVRVDNLPSAYRAPAALAGGYTRVAAYRHDRLVHLLYTDGLHGLSLFSQPGTLSGGSLPPGGDAVRVGTSSGVHFTWPGGDVVTWQVGSVVHTLVGDGTSSDVLAAARSLPRPSEPSVLGRLRGTARLVAELVSGGR
ncbi:MAG: sigma-E factor regulatory protein RseB domain-containing protein [Acidimicrobiales bacterium]